jgi:hypothetical protein
MLGSHIEYIAHASLGYGDGEYMRRFREEGLCEKTA